VEQEKKATGKQSWRSRLGARTGFGDKTLWDLLQLLIVPLVLAVIGLWFAAQQDARQQQIENQRAEAERKLAEQRAQDEALQAYLDQMSSLLLNEDRPLRQTEVGDEVRTLAQARTSTVIQRLDADHNRSVIRFLTEAGLTGNGQSSISILAGVDLQGARLEDVDLSTVDLGGTTLNDAKLCHATLINADLSEADLRNADLCAADLSNGELTGADIRHADLSNALLDAADLREADLREADLRNADLGFAANLSGANLSEADLRNADLDDANLKGANLSYARLNNASMWAAVLNNAKLSAADLSGAVIRDADLSDADQNGIFQDDFSDKSGGWYLGPRDVNARPEGVESSVAEFASGGLRLYNPPPSNLIVVTTYPILGRAIKDATVKVKATVTGKAPESDDAHWGIACRAAGDTGGTGYFLAITADGRPFIWRRKARKSTILRQGSPSDAFRGGATTNVLQAKCWENRLTFFVNSRRVLQVKDSEIQSGSIGLYVQDFGEEGIDILFDEFLITGPPPHFD